MEDISRVPGDGGGSDMQAMLEFRRSSNDRQTYYQLAIFAVFSVIFGAFLTVSVQEWFAVGILIASLCFALSFYAVARCITAILQPFDYICTFAPNCVRWSATNDAYPAGRIDSCDVRAVHIDLDDGGLSFDTGTFIPTGIRADIGITTDKLRIICDYLVTHWTSVTVYCVENGTRRCVSRV